MLDDELPVGLADHAFTPQGELADPELRLRLVELLEALGNVREADERVQHRRSYAGSSSGLTPRRARAPRSSLISEDFVGEVPGSMSAEPDVYKGHDGARRYFAGFDGLIEDVRFEPIEFVEQGDAVIVWLRLTGRGAASGIEVEQHAAVVTWVKDGKSHRDAAPPGHGSGPRSAPGLAASVAANAPTRTRPRRCCCSRPRRRARPTPGSRSARR